MFPGYESNELTPLPPPLTARDILEIVTRAQLDLKKKVKHFKMLLIVKLVSTSKLISTIIFLVWYISIVVVVNLTYSIIYY